MSHSNSALLFLYLALMALTLRIAAGLQCAAPHDCIQTSEGFMLNIALHFYDFSALQLTTPVPCKFYQLIMNSRQGCVRSLGRTGVGSLLGSSSATHLLLRTVLLRQQRLSAFSQGLRALAQRRNLAAQLFAQALQLALLLRQRLRLLLHCVAPCRGRCVLISLLLKFLPELLGWYVEVVKSARRITFTMKGPSQQHSGRSCIIDTLIGKGLRQLIEQHKT